ncbi:TlpA family protein disulfide reductase [Psychroserpens sp. MEBiC05023]
MKKITVLLLMSFLLINCSKTDKDILDESAKILNAVKMIEYDISSHVKNPQIDTIFNIKSYFDFTSKDSLIGSKYHFQFGDNENIFNGKSVFGIQHNKERIVYSNEPSLEFVSSALPIENSFYEIRNLLNQLIRDPSFQVTRLNDTIIDNVVNYNFQIKNEQHSNNESYSLIISKDDYLPSAFKKIYNGTDNFISSRFSKINKSATRSDSIWDIKRFNNTYLMLTPEELTERYFSSIKTKVGEKAPQWKLPQISNDSISLVELNANVVLLEFWFPNCGGCVSAIPEINDIQNKYSDKGLKVYGIEFTKQNHESIETYIKKIGIEYPTLFSGHKVSKAYGVQAAPTFFLIDKNGEIKYTSIGLNKIDLQNAINKSLNIEP